MHGRARSISMHGVEDWLGLARERDQSPSPGRTRTTTEHSANSQNIPQNISELS
jgi:hypothetical protein